jgi:hypothetical protein
VVPTAVLRSDNEGRADGVVPGRFDVKEERDVGMEEQRYAGVEAHAEDGEMKVLGFRGSDTLKKKNSSDGYDNIINDRRYI